MREDEDEDRDAYGVFQNTTCVGETADAIRCARGDGPSARSAWFPKKALHPRSDVKIPRDQGDLLVAWWFVREKRHRPDGRVLSEDLLPTEDRAIKQEVREAQRRRLEGRLRATIEEFHEAVYLRFPRHGAVLDLAEELEVRTVAELGARHVEGRLFRRLGRVDFESLAYEIRYFLLLNESD